MPNSNTNKFLLEVETIQIKLEKKVHKDDRDFEYNIVSEEQSYQADILSQVASGLQLS